MESVLNLSFYHTEKREGMLFPFLVCFLASPSPFQTKIHQSRTELAFALAATFTTIPLEGDQVQPFQPLSLTTMHSKRDKGRRYAARKRKLSTIFFVFVRIAVRSNWRIFWWSLPITLPPKPSLTLPISIRVAHRPWRLSVFLTALTFSDKLTTRLYGWADINGDASLSGRGAGAGVFVGGGRGSRPAVLRAGRVFCVVPRRGWVWRHEAGPGRWAAVLSTVPPRPPRVQYPYLVSPRWARLRACVTVRRAGLVAVCVCPAGTV